MAKKHWAQTPEGREILSRSMKRHHAKKGKTHVEEITEIPADIFAYALGHTECWIEAYAHSAGVSGFALAAQLGAILSRKGCR